MLQVMPLKRRLELLRAAWSGQPKGDSTLVLPLADLRAGESARIACVQCVLAARCERLLAYGLAQGRLVTLLQTSPAYLLRVDETELALDADVARCVQVERQWPAG